MLTTDAMQWGEEAHQSYGSQEEWEEHGDAEHGWTYGMDAASGRFYWCVARRACTPVASELHHSSTPCRYNHHTGVSSWEVPDTLDAQSAQAIMEQAHGVEPSSGASFSSPAVTSPRRRGKARHSTWVKRESRSGLPYYWNPETNECQWHHPFTGKKDPAVLRAQQASAGALSPTATQPPAVPQTPDSPRHAPSTPKRAWAESVVESSDKPSAGAPQRVPPQAPASSAGAGDEAAVAEAAAEQATPARERDAALEESAALADAITRLQVEHRANIAEWTDRFLAKQTELDALRERHTAEKLEWIQRVSDAQKSALEEYVRGRDEARAEAQAGQESAVQSAAASAASSAAAELAEAKKQHAAQLQDLRDAHAADTQALQEEVQALTVQLASAEQAARRASDAESEVATLQGESQQLAAAHQAAQQQVTKLSEEGEQLRAQVKALQQSLQGAGGAEQAAAASAAELQGVRQTLEAERHAHTSEVSALRAQLAEQQAEAAKELADAKAKLRETEAATSAAAASAEAKHSAEVQALESKLAAAVQAAQEEAARGGASALAAAVAEEAARWEARLQAQREATTQQLEEVRALERDKATAEIAALRAERDAARGLYQRESSERRKLAQQLIDLRGNVRVLARVRPVLPVEEESGAGQEVTRFDPANAGFLGMVDGRGRQHAFEFQRVFHPTSNQQDVFEEVQPLVDTVLDGYNVCIFAYGQTGSGKTHTMQGTAEEPGVNVRSLRALFQSAAHRRGSGTLQDATISVSVLEIYNENIRDLLRDGAAPAGGLQLRRGRGGEMEVEGLTQRVVDSPAQVLALMQAAGDARAVGGHDMNEHSSRSHLVVTVAAHVRHVNGSSTSSKLHLIDLAGSERVAKTDATGARLKEAQHINKSLSALGDVVAALGARGSAPSRTTHVPFRNSKLTHLLSDSLGGGSKVLMIVNVSPTAWNAPESIGSLRFAQRCSTVALGKAAKQQDSVTVADLRSQISALREQLGGAAAP